VVPVVETRQETSETEWKKRVHFNPGSFKLVNIGPAQCIASNSIVDQASFDVRGAVSEWYPKLYGQAPSEEQIDAILQIEMNGASAGYDVFAAK
jgi:hypothetical protein